MSRNERLSRTEALIGKDKVELLFSKTVAVFGLGGVGSFTASALARCGVGRLIIVDDDHVDISNMNRQLFAAVSTVGLQKCDAAEKYISDVAPDCEIIKYPIRFCKENEAAFDFSGCDYIADCIDTVSSKILLIEKAKEKNIPIISCMGTGNKLSPDRFKITDISKTSVCPLARVMRTELKKRGIKDVKVLWSDEPPHTASESCKTPASISFVPSSAGLLIAAEIVKDLIK